MENILAHALGQDVTQLAVEEKRRLLSRLLSRLAHEIRNPLSSLDVHLHLLEEDLIRVAPQSEALTADRFEIIRGELHRLENLVKQFLRLAGPSAIELATVELSQCIGHVCGLLQPEASTRGVELTAAVDPGLPPLRADPDQIVQALLNLVINAIQAVDRNGRVELRASLADDTFVLEVCDSGPGIPPERLGTIFEPYNSTKPEGSGIGLWITQQIVMAHGGAIRAANAPGGGAVFTVTLPRGGPPTTHG
ncbi:MAG: sensor histidine kinase [Limisphaerales bacterium]